MRNPGPYSKAIVRGCPDGRTKEGRFLRTTMLELFEQLGGADKVNPAQRMLVERIAILRLRCAKYDEKFLTGTWTDEDQLRYGWLSNSLSRLLRQVGLPGADTGDDDEPSFDDILRDIDAQRTSKPRSRLDDIGQARA